MKKSNKILSLLMTLIMIISIIPMSTIIASATEISGTCGENLVWTYDDTTYTLTISGIGDMYDYDWDSPWNSFKENIKMVVIESGVTTIGKFAFAGCEKLESVTIPDSIMSIGYVPFTVCKNLASITVDSNNKFYTNDEDGILFNKDKTKLICYPAGIEKTSYMVPEGVTTIEVGAFIYCEKLENVIIPEGVTTIGEATFGECCNLKNITIPESVTTICDEAFGYCERLSNVYYSGTVEQWDKILIGSNNSDLIKAPIHYNVHECNYNVTTTPPTCTEQGYTTYICLKCGDSYVDDYIDATGHNYVWTTIIDATCKKQGVNLGECSECGNLAVEYIDETEHNYVSIVTAPTCTEQGYTTYTCECGDTYIDNYVDTLGHTEETIPAVAPTCTETGLTEGTKCSVCDETLTEQKELPANGHTPANAIEENLVAPTCTENGSKDVVVYCSVCDEEISRETVTIDATGHVDNDGNGYCDKCDEQLCNHNCHKSGFAGFIWKILRFVNRIFGTNKYCECGVTHY